MTTEKTEIRPFEGDFAGLERMAHAAWRDEYGIDSFPNLYKPSYLQYLLMGVKDPRLALAAYRGGEIEGFLLNLPRAMSLDGKIFNAALTCLMVVRKQAMRRGVASSMIDSALAMNEELGLDFALFYLETGHRSSVLIDKFRRAGRPVEWVKRMRAVVRVLNLEVVKSTENVKRYEELAMRALGAARKPRPVSNPAIREATKEDVPRLMELMNAHAVKLRLARVFRSGDELAREIISPPTARTLVYEKNGAISGALSWVTVEHAGKKAVDWAWINHVCWDALSGRERRDLLGAFLSEAKGQGAAGVVEWTKKTYPTFPLYASGFVPYPRSVNMWGWNFRSPEVDLHSIPRVYEVQI